jgi:hypothetical protein
MPAQVFEKRERHAGERSVGCPFHLPGKGLDAGSNSLPGAGLGEPAVEDFPPASFVGLGEHLVYLIGQGCDTLGSNLGEDGHDGIQLDRVVIAGPILQARWLRLLARLPPGHCSEGVDPLEEGGGRYRMDPDHLSTVTRGVESTRCIASRFGVT